MAEHRRHLDGIRAAAEAGDPEAAAAYAEGVEVLNRAQAAQTEREALLARTAQQQVQIKNLKAQIEQLQEQTVKLQLLEFAQILRAAMDSGAGSP